jgi:hypothetical protein
MEAVGGHRRTRRQGQKRQDVRDNTSFNLDLERIGKPLDLDGRRRRKARLDHLGFGDAQRIVGRLQAAIVEQCDLHGGVRGQRPAQQGLDPCPRRMSVVGGPDGGYIFAKLAAGNACNEVHAAIRREGLATGEQQASHNHAGSDTATTGRLSARGILIASHGGHRFGCGATRSFCSRQDEGSTGRWLT